MPKRKKTRKFPSGVKYFLVLAVTVALTWFVCQRLVSVAKNSDYFKIKTIIIDPSLKEIDTEDLRVLKGKNIFTVDLGSVHQRLTSRYPDISELKVVRRFPDQIHLTAKKRLPFAQLRVQNRMVIVDDTGIVLSIDDRVQDHLPVIQGDYANVRLSLGMPLTYSSIRTALKIIKAMERYGTESSYDLERIDVRNLSKIGVYLTKDLIAFVDNDKIDRKIKILNLILAQGHLDLKTVRYIDLRFKEPIVGKK